MTAMMQTPAKPALVQVGQTALRGPDGNWLDPVPLFILADADSLVDGLTDGERKAADDLGRLIGSMDNLKSILKGEKYDHENA